MLTKLLVFASMCKYVTLREKEFKQLPSKGYQDMVKTFHRISVSRNIYTVPSLAAFLSIKPALRSYAHSGTLVRADRHPRPRESRHDRHPRRRVKVLAGIAASCRITAARNSASMCPITLAINSQQLGRSKNRHGENLPYTCWSGDRVLRHVVEGDGRYPRAMTPSVYKKKGRIWSFQSGRFG